MFAIRSFVFFACFISGAISAQAQVRECTPTDQFGRACISAGKVHKALYSKRVIEWTFKNSCSKSVNVKVGMNNGKPDGINVAAKGSATAMCFEEHGCTAFTGYDVECDEKDKIYKNGTGGSTGGEGSKDKNTVNSAEQRRAICMKAAASCKADCINSGQRRPLCIICIGYGIDCSNGVLPQRSWLDKYSLKFNTYGQLPQYDPPKTRTANRQPTNQSKTGWRTDLVGCECSSQEGVMLCKQQSYEFRCVKDSKNGAITAWGCAGGQCRGSQRQSPYSNGNGIAN